MEMEICVQAWRERSVNIVEKKKYDDIEEEGHQMT